MNQPGESTWEQGHLRNNADLAKAGMAVVVSSDLEEVMEDFRIGSLSWLAAETREFWRVPR